MVTFTAGPSRIGGPSTRVGGPGSRTQTVAGYARGIDWFLTNDNLAAETLRVEVRAYLERHAAPGSDLGGAELAFGELLNNAVEHTDGGVWVSLDWGGINPIVTVHDLGPGFTIDSADTMPEPGATSGRGLMIATHFTRELEVAAKRAGGVRVTAVLDVERRPSVEHDFAPSGSSRLPAPEEAVEGLFEREGFLRALTVELARAVEFEHGPDAAEAAVAELGASVGGRMEAVYRANRNLEERLTEEQLGRFYVELKAAIGGDFYLVEVDDRRIVLGNRACPFGAAVRRAPSLCRMTSSVFGGIAARNIDGDAYVHLEERIAVGDPECRVVVWLGEPPETAVALHRYRNRASDRR